MKIRHILIYFSLIFAFLFVGCQQTSLFCLDLSKLDYNIKYRVNNLDNDILAFFPIVTTDKINRIEIEDYSSIFYMKKGGTDRLATVKLKPLTQEKLNQKFDDYYISFLKCQILIDTQNIQQYNSIELWQVKLNVYTNSTKNLVEYNNKFFSIEITADNDIFYPNYESELELLTEQIKNNLKQIV